MKPEERKKVQEDMKRVKEKIVCRLESLTQTRRALGSHPNLALKIRLQQLEDEDNQELERLAAEQAKLSLLLTIKTKQYPFVGVALLLVAILFVGSSIYWFDFSGQGDELTGNLIGEDFLENDPPLQISAAPTQGTPVLNSTTSINNSRANRNGNLTLFNVSTADSDGDVVKNVYTLYENKTPREMLVVSFDSGGSNNTTVKDYSSFKSNGTAMGGAFLNSSAGYDGGGAYQLDGVDDYVNFSHSTHLNITKNVTVSLWMKGLATPALFDVVFMKTSSTSWGDGYGIFFNSATQLRFFVTSYSSNVAFGTISATQWNHVVGRYDGSNVEIFINGVKGTSDPYTGSVTTTTAPLDLGRGASNSYNFNGLIDEFRLYNYSLTDQQVKALYENKSHLMVSSELISGQSWYGCITPTDAGADGTESCSENVTIDFNSAPTQSTPILNSTNSSNLTEGNLTLYPQGLIDLDGDSISVIIEWYRNNRLYPVALPEIDFSKVIAILPFENFSASNDTERDFSYTGHNVSANGAIWNGSGGYNSSGGYQFDGTDDALEFQSQPVSSLLGAQFSFLFWYNPGTSADRPTFGFNGSSNSNNLNPMASYDSYLTFGDGSSWQLMTALPTATAEQYTHYGIVDNSSHYVVYINGVESYNAAISINPSASGNRPFVIGQSGFSSGFENWHNGVVDEVLFYNGSLTAAQVYEVFNRTTNRTTLNQTEIGESWYACSRPYDGGAQGGRLCSDTLSITAGGVTGTKPTFKGFDGQTTNFDSTTDYTSVNYPILENSTFGLIKWLGTALNVDNNNFTLNVLFRDKSVYVNSSALNRTLNDSANVSIYRLNSSTAPTLYVDGQVCGRANCSLISYSSGIVSFNVTHFSNYSVGNNTNLTIWDASDTLGGRNNYTTGQDIMFFANYTNVTNGSFLTGGGYYCKIYFNDIGVATMYAYNSTQYYNYTKVGGFTSTGTHNYNISCFSDQHGGENLNSSDSIVLDNVPSIAVLIAPANNSFITNRTPQFRWNNSADSDSDTLTYQILVDDNTAFNNVEINVSSITETTTNTSYDSATTLAVDTTFYWKVRAFDGKLYGNFSNVSNFTLQSYLAISVTTSSVSFGTLAPGEQANTTTGSPAPFRIINVGNVKLNTSINASSYFSAIPMNTSYYQFKVAENQSGAFEIGRSAQNWTNMSEPTIPAVVNLDWQTSAHDFLTHLRITIPDNESSGLKNSTVGFTIS